MLPGFLLLVTLVGLAGPTVVSQPSQAGLVVQFDEGRVVTRCISFEGESITGADLLSLSGLTIVTSSSGLGITVCKFDNLGCDYPVEACFCQCMSGSQCHYWNYFYRDPDQAAWVYSAQGALLHKIRPGAVEAWVWGDGRTPPADDLTFQAICPAATAAPTDTALPPSAVPTAAATLAVMAQTATQPPEVTASASPTAPSNPSPTPGVGGGQAAPSYWPFALTFLALVVIGLLAWRRLK